MFDIAKLDTNARSEAGAEMTIRNPKSGAPILDDAGKPQWIKFRGRNCDIFRNLQRTLQARRTAMQSRGIVFTDEDGKQERHEVLAAMTLDWSFDTMDGQPFKFSPDNVARLWADPRWEWLTGMAYGFVLEEGNFLAL
jgi:hypothetical protein